MNEQLLQQFIADIPDINKYAFCSMFHGLTHWQRVEQFGLLLARNYPDADIDVIRWFAYLHDSMRGQEGPFQEHGRLAGCYVKRIRKTYLKDLTDDQIKLLKQACQYHTIVRRRKEPTETINICFDADRLDLWRVGIRPDPKLMATEAGKRYAALTFEELNKLI